MSGLAALLAGRTDPDLYLWHNAAHVEDVEHAVEKAGWKFAYVDGWTVQDEQGFLKACGAALDLPDQDAADLERLTQRLCEGRDEKGLVLLWDGWSPLARGDEPAFGRVREALTGCTGEHGGSKVAVLLRGEGPQTDIPELPDAPH